MAYRTQKRGTLVSPVVLLLVTLVIGGCTELDEGVFINDTSKSLDVSFIEIEPKPGAVMKRLHIPPQSTSSTTVLPCVRVDVRSEDGAISYSHKFLIPRGMTDYANKSHRPATYHYLLSPGGLYLIPYRYWASWQEHRGEMLNQQIDWLCSDARRTK